nr:MAG TPA: hypothetical protein [Caudoviricetes sp.]
MFNIGYLVIVLTKQPSIPICQAWINSGFHNGVGCLIHIWLDGRS